MTKTLLLIDANALIHRAFHALPPMTSREGIPTQAIYGVASILLKVWREERPDYAMALFDRPEPTFRKEEFKAYKEHRPKAPDTLIEQIIEARNLFDSFGISIFEVPGFEADDLIGTFATRFMNSPDLKIVILTGDLDTLQLVSGNKVVVKTLKIGVSSTEIYDERAVIDRYGLTPETLPDYKALVGDQSDNIPGIAGIGPKTASALLKKYGSLSKLLSSIEDEPKYREKFKGQEDNIALYRRLVFIRRDVPLPSIELSSLGTKQEPERVIPYFDKLGFESLKKRFFSEKTKNNPLKPAKTMIITQGLFRDNFNETMKPREDIFILKEEEITASKASELSSLKTKIGFSIKESIKKTMRENILIKGPYFDLGVGFWVCYPEFKNYTPQTLTQEFLKVEWTGANKDYILLYDFLQNEITKNNLKKVFEKIETPLIEILAETEERGIAIEYNALNTLKKEIQEEIRANEEAIYNIAGEKININSNRELANLLFQKMQLNPSNFKKTPGGKRSTDEEVLRGLIGKHPIISLILTHRELFKLLSTYIRPILKSLNRDSRIRTTFIQTGTATGRLSSQSPNLQNIPTGNALAHKLRKIFIPTKGCSFAAFDYSQLELRILASLSEDANMIAAFKRGDDIHTATAAAVFNESLDKVTPQMRKIAKTLNFGIVYGMGPRSFAKAAGIKQEEAKSFISNYFKEYYSVKKWQAILKEEARNTGMVTNLNGRLRRVPLIRAGTMRQVHDAERAVLNMPIQSLGADIIKLAMIQVSHVLEKNSLWKENTHLLLSIHDELLFEARNDIIKEVTPIIINAMESVYNQRVPLVVNVKYGENWAELK